jgi:hypothetical protein
MGVQLSPPPQKKYMKKHQVYIPFNTRYMYNTLLNTIARLLSPYNSPNTQHSLLSRPNNSPVPNYTTRIILMYKQFAEQPYETMRLPSLPAGSWKDENPRRWRLTAGRPRRCCFPDDPSGSLAATHDAKLQTVKFSLVLFQSIIRHSFSNQ